MQNCVNPQKQWHCGDFVNFLANGAVAGKNFKMLINTEKSGIVYCMECGKYVGLTLTWDVLKRDFKSNRITSEID